MPKEKNGHYNPKSRRDNRKKRRNKYAIYETKNVDPMLILYGSQINGKPVVKTEKSAKIVKLSKPTKTIVNDTDHNNNYIQSLMNFSSYKDVGMKIPVKYNIFGFLKRESQKLIYNILEKNFEYITGNIATFDNLSNILPRQKIIEILKIMCSKRKITKSYKDKLYPFYLHVDKYRDHYIVLDLYKIFENYRTKCILQNKQLINFIEIRSHVYSDVNTKKYKFHNKRLNNFDGAKVEICNTSILEHSYPLYNRIPLNGNDKIVPCVYRFYFKPSVDLKDESRINIKNKTHTHLMTLVNNVPESMNLIAIANVLRYKSRFKNNAR